MGLILDTCLFIAEERGRFDLAGFLTNHSGQPGAASAITFSELMMGVHYANTAERRASRMKTVERQMSLVRLLAFGRAEALEHSKLVVYLAKSGNQIGNCDAIIASTALAHDWSVATLNTFEFQRVPNLKVIDASPWLVEKAP